MWSPPDVGPDCGHSGANPPSSATNSTWLPSAETDGLLEVTRIGAPVDERDATAVVPAVRSRTHTWVTEMFVPSPHRRVSSPIPQYSPTKATTCPSSLSAGRVGYVPLGPVSGWPALFTETIDSAPVARSF